MKESFPAQCEAAPATQSFFQTGMRRLRTAIQQISKLGQALKGKVSRNALAFYFSFEISAGEPYRMNSIVISGNSTTRASAST